MAGMTRGAMKFAGIWNQTAHRFRNFLHQDTIKGYYFDNKAGTRFHAISGLPLGPMALLKQVFIGHMGVRTPGMNSGQLSALPMQSELEAPLSDQLG
jgi:hypothetical protein